MTRRRSRSRGSQGATPERALRRRPPPTPAKRGAAATDRTATLFTRVVAFGPFVAIVLVLAPYLWPLDRGPTSDFSDIHHYHAPMAELLGAGLHRDGELPRWNPEDFAGMPVVGDPQSEMYNPLQWLVLWRPSVHAFGVLIVGYTLAGAAGFLLYARALEMSPAAAAAGAVAFTLGGKLLLHLVLPGHTVFAPFFLVPLLLATLHRLASRPGSAAIAATASLVGLLAVSLHPQLLFYSACAVAPIALVTIAAASRPRRAFAAAAVAVLLGTALAAVHLMPIVAFEHEFSRGQPAFFEAGHASEDIGLGRGWFADTVSGTSAAAGTVVWESHYFVGGVILALAGVGLFAWPRGHPRRRLAWLYGVLALVLLLFGLGPSGAIEPIVRGLPGFALFRIPARALVVLGLAAAVLCALGVEALIAAPRERCRVVAGAAAAVALVLLVLTRAGGAHVAALAVAGAMLLDRPPWIPLGGMLVLAAVAMDTAVVVAPYVQTAPEREIGRPAPGLVLPADLDQATRIAELQRAAAEPGIPQLAVRRRALETVAGFNPLIPWRFVLYASAAGGFDPFTYGFDVQVLLLAPTTPVLLDLLGVTHVLHPPSDERRAWHWERSATALPRAYLVPGPIVVDEGRDGSLVPRELEALARLAEIDPRTEVLLHGSAADHALVELRRSAELESFRPVAITERRPNRLALDVHLDHPGILVLNEPFFPGWQAHVDGRKAPVLRANVLFRALALEPGAHHVELEFSPASWRVGWWISVAAIAIVIALAVGGSRSAHVLAERTVGGGADLTRPAG